MTILADPFGSVRTDLTRPIHCYNRATRKTGMIDIPINTTCTVPSCATGPQGGPGYAEIAILNVVLNAGSVIVSGVPQGSTLYLCEEHFNEDGEAEADTLAELIRAKPIT